jgi:hypothetical protein
MLAGVALESGCGLVLLGNRNEVYAFEVMGMPDDGKGSDAGRAKNAQPKRLVRRSPSL